MVPSPITLLYELHQLYERNAKNKTLLICIHCMLVVWCNLATLKICLACQLLDVQCKNRTYWVLFIYHGPW